MTRSPTKKASNPGKPKYASPPANPTQVFTYKLKPTQKVHLPADHPQTPTIQNKDKVEIVFNDADAAIANSQPSAQLVSQVPHNIYVAPHPQQQVSTVTVGESRRAATKRTPSRRNAANRPLTGRARGKGKKGVGKDGGSGKWLDESESSEEEYPSGDEAGLQGDTESQGQAGVVEVQTHPPHTIIHQGTAAAAAGVPVQEVQVQYQQLPTAAGTVTLKYDNYNNDNYYNNEHNNH